MLSCCSRPGDPTVPRRGPGHRAAERTQNLDFKVLFVLSSPQVTNKEKIRNVELSRYLESDKCLN